MLNIYSLDILQDGKYIFHLKSHMQSYHTKDKKLILLPLRTTVVSSIVLLPYMEVLYNQKEKTSHYLLFCDWQAGKSDRRSQEMYH